MDRLVETTKLEEILREQIASYAGPVEGQAGISELYFVENPQKQVYCVVAPYDPVYKKTDIALMARIVDDHVVIEVDKNGDPLIEKLQQAGIPDSQISIAWKQRK